MGLVDDVEFIKKVVGYKPRFLEINSLCLQFFEIGKQKKTTCTALILLPHCGLFLVINVLLIFCVVFSASNA